MAMWTNDDTIEHLLIIVDNTERHSDANLIMVHATRSLITDYVTGGLDVAEEEMRAAEEVQLAPEQIEEAHLNMEHRRFDIMAEQFFGKISLVVDHCHDEFEADRARTYLIQANRMLSLSGQPGTGKTTVTHLLVEWLLRQDGRVLFTVPTNMGASRLQKRYGDRLDTSTCHSAFGLNAQVASGSCLEMYNLVVIDEISLLEGWHYDRIAQLWLMAEKHCVVIALGDRWQQLTFGDVRPQHTASWLKIDLPVPYRCKDGSFGRILDEIRTAKPTAEPLRAFYKRKAWTPPGLPTPDGIRKLL